MNLSRNGLIVLISVIFVAGAGTAYAGIVLPMITLAGDVTIDGDMTCAGCVDSADIADGTVTVADLEVPPKYGLVFTAGGDNYPLGSTNYLGLGDVFTSSGDAAFFIPFDSTITDIRAGASNTSPDTIVTYTVKNLGGNAVSFGCSAVYVLSCSNTGSVDVNAGQKLFIEITGGCVGTCPTNISDVRVSIGLLPR